MNENQGNDGREEKKEVMTEEERQLWMEQKTKEMQDTFSYDSYQIVRKEFFAHQRDPSVIIRCDSVTFNQACVNRLEDTVYIQVMVNIEEKRLAIRKCCEQDKGALRWCYKKPERRVSRRMSGKWFAAKLFKDMGWDTGFRYKILGYQITEGKDTIFVFDLMETEKFEDRRKARRENAATEVEQEHASTETQTEEQLLEVGEKRKRSQGQFPEEWGNSYGLSVYEQNNYRHVDLKKGYTPVAPEEPKEAEFISQ